VRVVRGYDAGIEAALTDKVTAERDEELRVFLSELRLVKDEFEIGELQKAVDSTVRGFEDVVKVLDKAEATSERYIEGTFFLRARVEGNDVGYGSICAAGPHATTLHWVRNDGPVRSGDLLLLDAGVETHTYYTADVTRTLPISGRYTELQKKIYDAVYDAQEAGIAAVKPGAKYRDFHDAAQRVLTERLVEWGLVEGPVERVLELGLQRRWTLHGTGHMLGMDVHDCAAARTETYVDGTLEPGMVLTVEPGLYFQADDLTVPEEYRGIGVRIEDDILVTEDGNRNLSAGLPRRSDEVEAWMAALKG
jgi:Xaa-Pro aminopeptidase